MIYQVIKSLLVIHNHAHIKFYFISGSFSAINSLTSWMASLSVKFQSSTWTLVSFSHDWKIKFSTAEYPPLSLIFSLHSLWKSCNTIFISYPGEYEAGLRLAWDLCSSGYFLGVHVNPLKDQKQNAHGAADYAMPMWLLLPAHFQNVPLSVTRISWEIPQVCTKPAHHLAFTVPGNILNEEFLDMWSGVWRNRHFWHLTLLFLDFLSTHLSVW